MVPGQEMAADAVTLDSAETVNGQKFMISKKDGSVFVDDAKVVKTDIETTNGVIHVIDTVIIPN